MKIGGVSNHEKKTISMKDNEVVCKSGKHATANEFCTFFGGLSRGKKFRRS